MLPVFLHIPHASTLIPKDYHEDYLLTPDALSQELLKLTDLYTDELYEFVDAERFVFPVSRFLVDAERFPEDEHEPMAARGMGALYTATTDLQPLRPQPDAGLRAELLDRYYWPHHQALDRAVHQALAEKGRALIFDCHSYPSKALPYELENQSLHRPEIGIGTDAFHTPVYLKEALAESFTAAGYEVAFDTPFAGSLVPLSVYGKDARAMSVMIEIRKDLYMDEATGNKNSRFDMVRRDIGNALRAAHAACTAQNP